MYCQPSPPSGTSRTFHGGKEVRSSRLKGVPSTTRAEGDSDQHTGIRVAKGVWYLHACAHYHLVHSYVHATSMMRMLRDEGRDASGEVLMSRYA